MRKPADKTAERAKRGRDIREKCKKQYREKIDERGKGRGGGEEYRERGEKDIRRTRYLAYTSLILKLI